ncbi:pyridoxal-phosphate dependent enzyme [Myxococcota bacterium]|nr:pyridoxal-phosphate dependent enzyme [Myxococcota bacterium]MBU1379969.1 pyridoxal-phosphate dependent enzyme [Myxococcota bacterium]MBU1497756.1 pyridoxal-phosphate dependent enzyme [Myxococcota bacterium]
MYNPVKLKYNKEVLNNTVKRCRERNILIPTFKQLENPDLIPEKIKAKLPEVGLWDVDPINLFRISWKNDIKTGLFGDVNYMEFPKEITGVKARVIGLVGKYFPTGAHKVGAAFGCLVPRLITGEFDPSTQRAVWPSTGNYCRGGAFDCALLACTPVAILPEEMSQERFNWLREIGSEVIATPGSESNVKEIYDKCWEIRKTDPKAVIFNQFDEFGNAIFHHEVTGSAMLELYNLVKKPNSRLAAYVSATGSAGTIAAGDRLKKSFPNMKIVATEALQCPTILRNGFGAHRIEGIGDKHVPWVHNTRNTDVITAIDDEDTMRLLRLFNEDAGKAYLRECGVSEEVVSKLELLGISSICNVLSAIKTAKYYEMTEDDVIITVLTDSAEMYGSRLVELNENHGPFKNSDAIITYEGSLMKQAMDNMRELSYWDRKAVHNLKYFTWIEQQGKDITELNTLWHPEFWDEIFSVVPEWDKAIEEFNALTGL